jgi:hypothetical protein
MKKTYALALLVAILFLFVWNTFGQKKHQSRVTWEYKQAGRATESGEQELNQLGAQGWELISVNENHTVFYLKRPK